MKNINIMGYLYRVSNRNYERWLKAKLSKDKREREEAYKYLGRPQGHILPATDISQEEAEELLKGIEQE
jgi:hypothetical protein